MVATLIFGKSKHTMAILIAFANHQDYEMKLTSLYDMMYRDYTVFIAESKDF